MRENWNQKYEREGFLYGEEANQFIQDISKEIPFQGRSLAIAEGEGRNALFLAKQAKEQNRSLDITLWDYAEIGLAKAQARAIAENLDIKTECLDLQNVDWVENSFDNIFCVFGHFPTELKFRTLHGIRHALKNGGWFVGEVYSKAQLDYKTGGPPIEDLLYDLSDFTAVFGQDHIKHLFLGEVHRTEGKLHNGLSHVIQFAIQIKKAE